MTLSIQTAAPTATPAAIQTAASAGETEITPQLPHERGEPGTLAGLPPELIALISTPLLAADYWSFSATNRYIREVLLHPVVQADLVARTERRLAAVHRHIDDLALEKPFSRVASRLPEVLNFLCVNPDYVLRDPTAHGATASLFQRAMEAVNEWAEGTFWARANGMDEGLLIVQALVTLQKNSGLPKDGEHLISLRSRTRKCMSEMMCFTPAENRTDLLGVYCDMLDIDNADCESSTKFGLVIYLMDYLPGRGIRNIQGRLRAAASQLPEPTASNLNRMLDPNLASKWVRRRLAGE